MLGKLFVVLGSMFSGKTTWIISLCQDLLAADIDVSVFKPAIDNRYGLAGQLVSHDGGTIPAIPISDVSQIMEHIQGWMDPETGYVAKQVWVVVDETQFLSGIAEVVQQLLAIGVNVVCAGLDLNFLREPFGEMPVLETMATQVIRRKAKCAICGGDAGYTQRIVNGQPAKRSDPLVVIGVNQYEARCETCHVIAD